MKGSFRFRGESLLLDAEARATAPGRFVALPDEAGHIPHYERPQVVNPLLIGFLG